MLEFLHISSIAYFKIYNKIFKLMWILLDSCKISLILPESNQVIINNLKIHV